MALKCIILLCLAASTTAGVVPIIANAENVEVAPLANSAPLRAYASAQYVIGPAAPALRAYASAPITVGQYAAPVFRTFGPAAITAPVVKSAPIAVAAPFAASPIAAPAGFPAVAKISDANLPALSAPLVYTAAGYSGYF